MKGATANTVIFLSIISILYYFGFDTASKYSLITLKFTADSLIPICLALFVMSLFIPVVDESGSELEMLFSAIGLFYMSSLIGIYSKLIFDLNITDHFYITPFQFSGLLILLYLTIIAIISKNTKPE